MAWTIDHLEPHYRVQFTITPIRSYASDPLDLFNPPNASQLQTSRTLNNTTVDTNQKPFKNARSFQKPSAIKPRPSRQPHWGSGLPTIAVARPQFEKDGQIQDHLEDTRVGEVAHIMSVG